MTAPLSLDDVCELLHVLEATSSVMNLRLQLSPRNFDELGRIEILVGDVLSIFLCKISDSELELVMSMAAVESRRQTAYEGRQGLGECVAGAVQSPSGAEPAAPEALFSRRIDLSILDEEGFIAELTDFVRQGAQWRGIDPRLRGGRASERLDS